MERYAVTIVEMITSAETTEELEAAEVKPNINYYLYSYTMSVLVMKLCSRFYGHSSLIKDVFE